MESNAHGYIPRRSAIHEVLRLMVGMDDEVPRNTTCIPRWSQKSELQNTCGGGADDDDDDASSLSGDCCTIFRGFLKRCCCPLPLSLFPWNPAPTLLLWLEEEEEEATFRLTTLLSTSGAITEANPLRWQQFLLTKELLDLAEWRRVSDIKRLKARVILSQTPRSQCFTSSDAFENKVLHPPSPFAPPHHGRQEGFSPNTRCLIAQEPAAKYEKLRGSDN